MNEYTVVIFSIIHVYKFLKMVYQKACIVVQIIKCKLGQYSRDILYNFWFKKKLVLYLNVRHEWEVNIYMQ